MSPILFLMIITASVLAVFIGEYLLNNGFVLLLILGISMIPIIWRSDLEYKKDKQRERFACWERLKATASPRVIEGMKWSGYYDDMENEMKKWRESNG